MEERHHVVIIGGGFGGLAAARALRDAPVRVTLMDRRNFHLFQPLLYQVATGGLSPANIAAPLRRILRRQANARVLLGEVTSIDVERRMLLMGDEESPYDTLILATGARHHYFGNAQWEPVAPGLKTIEDATEIRGRILLRFEQAERARDSADIGSLLTFVVVGGGPTGVELAGALREIARDTLRSDFRSIDPAAARVILLEAQDRILPPYAPSLSAHARRALERLGVGVRTGVTVTDVTAEAVTIRSADGSEQIETRTVLWAAGVQGSPLGARVAGATGAELDRAGRVVVNSDLTLPGRPEIFDIGDLAHVGDGAGGSLPAVAQVAIQQRRYVAGAIGSRQRGKPQPPPFHYRDRGSMATIGRAAAVADLKWLRLWGYPGWLVWLFIHLISIEQYEDRLLVLVQWAWNYLTRNRSARLITGDSGDDKD